ncbi:MAG: 2-C-methyl-D-erythritol 4-phosphate cytidylyltransferase [Propionibacteriaceae bacterium]|jgi:2-C-methyl-D-erythritol 4-phosphate cytidylyltransferase|nr:2-C-methyl-D-erythritol 4-phosphate cytidylyltransferase [Propionibacteriaceae bacterium]
MTGVGVSAIVVAAGAGVRLRSSTPKALVRIGGKPLVLLALESLAAGGVTKAVVAVPRSDIDDFDNALRAAPLPIRIVPGGATRQESVRLALDSLVTWDVTGSDDDVVLVHDAARPLAPPEVALRVTEAIADGASAAIPVIPVVDTIRALTPAGSVVVDRNTLRAVQTPQGFRKGVLRAAHQLALADEVSGTDDAMLAERAGFNVKLVEGSPAATKITTPHDLAVVRALVEG